MGHLRNECKYPIVPPPGSKERKKQGITTDALFLCAYLSGSQDFHPPGANLPVHPRFFLNTLVRIKGENFSRSLETAGISKSPCGEWLTSSRHGNRNCPLMLSLPESNRNVRLLFMRMRAQPLFNICLFNGE